MTATYKQILDAFKQKQWAPVYIIDGDEPYYLDKIVQLFENSILNDTEKDFNLYVLYGSDTKSTDLKAYCRRLPMFANQQVIILKDAGNFREFNELKPYIKSPSKETILLIDYRYKKLNKDWVTTFKDTLVYFNSDKIKEYELPKWIKELGKEKQLEIADKEAELLAIHIGNNLQTINNELEKVKIGVPDAQQLTAELIQKYIGINREYNVFEFCDAFINRNQEKYYRILSYFLNNIKAAPMVLICNSLFTKFQQIYRANIANNKTGKELAQFVGCPEKALFIILKSKALWNIQSLEDSMLILAQYNSKAVGVNSQDKDAALLKELVGRLELVQ